MDQTCPNCGTINRASARFCQYCATPFQGGAAPYHPGTGLLSPKTMLSNRYIIVQKVGEGGMAAVYKAADARITGKLWAIKELSAATITNPLDKQEAVDAFRREAQVLSKLAHRNIPRVVDFFSEGGKQYLVMEFIEGKTLGDILEQRGRPLSETEVRPWAEQLCDVMAYLHSQTPPIVFRDLKPHNIMLDRDGSIKLIDFGIVRFFQPGKARDTVSFGTAGYSPPEQYGKGQTDARSDLYALGVTLHHLLTNHDPAMNPFRFERVRKLNPSVSATTEATIMRALEQDPVRRWQSAKEMRQALVKPMTPPTPTPPQPALLPSPPARPIPSVPAPRPLPPSPFPLRGAELAGFGRRFFAYFIDGFLISFIFNCPLSFISAIQSDPSTDPDLAEALALLLACLSLILLLFFLWYYIFLPARSGQTLGKKMMGIKIVTTNGDSPGTGRCFLRLIGYMLSALILYIGFLMPLWTENKQALHDMIASTYVVRT